MCGIGGILDLDSKAPPSAATAMLGAVLRRLVHRGPQERGTYISGGAAFGAQRLSIRGLEDGRQPVVDAETGVMAVCNGEIDNHADLRVLMARQGRPVTQATDIAVIPALYLEYGERFAERLEGAFALALWDPRCNKLILARDRAGERPLFYHRKGGIIIFASEIAALTAALPGIPPPDSSAIAGYLQAGCFAAPETPVTGIEKLGPGEMAVFTARASGKARYWRWPVAEAAQRPSNTAEFDGIFRAAVLRQSAIDVDFGLFLSGGVDSSLVAAVMRAVRPAYKPPCYTLRFAETSYDEGDYAARVAAHLGLDMISVPVTPGLFATELPRLVALTGEPLADPAWIPTMLLARRAVQDVRLVFGGEGADELFGGYPTYPGARLARQYANLPASIRRSLATMARRLPPSERKMPLSYLLRRFVEGDGLAPLARHRQWLAPVAPDIARALGAVERPALSEPVRGAVLDHLQRHDLEIMLAEGLLTKADRSGMSASLEIRTPYLDRAVMEYAATLTPRDRVHGFATKPFLKAYAAGYLPHDIVHRRKRGLSISLAAWLRGPLKSWAWEKLSSGRLSDAGLDPETALSLLGAHNARQADHARALWTLLALDEWLAWHRAARTGKAEEETRPCAA